MGKNLVIVESPGKVSSIGKYLGADYKVVASVGHIREIPKKGLGINVAKQFEPTYEVSHDKKDVVKKIKDEASKANIIYLASDKDREGEAIAFSVYEVLNKADQKKCKRIVFKEISKKALLKAIEDAHEIDMDMVNSQKARQVLDRLIGYKISPMLWKEVADKTSAGRVQSVALKILAEREKEISNFKPDTFWYIDASLKGKGEEFIARTITEDKDNRFTDAKKAEEAFESLKKSKYTVGKIDKKEREAKPNPPFDTASLQVTASSVFGWPTKKTAQIAQSLYESGKCFLPGVMVTTENGNIVPIESINGQVNVNSISMDRLSPCVVGAMPFKKEYNGEVVEIVLNNDSYKVTPDHLFPVYDFKTGEIINKEARDIVPDNDYLLLDKSDKRTAKNGERFNIINIFDNNDIAKTKMIRVKFKRGFVKKIKNIKSYVCKEFTIHTYYKYRVKDILPLNIVKEMIFDGALSESEIRDNYLEIGYDSPSCKYVKFPFDIGEDFYYLVGLMMSDGHSSRNSKIHLGALLKKNPRKIDIGNYVDISDEINKLMKKFGCYDSSTGLSYSNNFIKILLGKFGVPEGSKSDIIDMDERILISDHKCILSFIAGLWDGDGYFTFNKIKGKNCSIQAGYTSKSDIMIKKMRILLSEFGVYGYVHTDNRSHVQTIKVSIYDVAKIYGLIEPYSLIKGCVYRSIVQDVKTINNGFSRSPYNMPLLTVINKEMSIKGVSKNVLSKSSGVDYWSFGRESNKNIVIPVSDINKINNVLGSETIWKYGQFTYEQVKNVKKEHYSGAVYCLTSCNGYFLVNNGLWTHNCTYIRTDSFSISEEALADVRNHIESEHGKKYLSLKANVYKKKEEANSQGAHECIRPTHIEDNGDDLAGDNKKLYGLLRDRFIACQMNPAVFDTVSVTVDTDSKHKLIAKGQTVKFDGWTKVYKYNSSKEELLPLLSEKEALKLNDINKTENETQPPPRYSDATLTKRLEKDGVGRPATWASIAEGLSKRVYIEEAKGKKNAIKVTDLGMRVYEFLQPKFSDFIMDIKFTADLEEDLDKIEHGKRTFLDVVKGTYDIMMKKIGSSVSSGGKNGSVDSGVQCPICKNGNITEKNGKFGKFLSCDQYPSCKSIFVKDDDGNFKIKEKKSWGDKSGKGRSVPTSEDKCPECEKAKRDGRIVEKKGQYGIFYACNQYPKCKTTFTKDGDGKFKKK